MDTLIELFDPQALWNVLSPAQFRPGRILYLGSAEMEHRRQDLLRFFDQLDYHPELHFFATDTTDCRAILQTLTYLHERWPDCAIDVTGGGEIPLLATGIFCAQEQVPVFYFDRGRARFLNVWGCDGLEGSPCTVALSVENVVALAGGSVLGSTHLNHSEDPMDFESEIRAVWKLFLAHQRRWSEYMLYFQQLPRVAVPDGDGLSWAAPVNVSLGNQAVSAPRGFLQELRNAGVLTELSYHKKQAHFRYKNDTMRRWLGISGIWLELFNYVTAVSTKRFDDVKMSVTVDWDGDRRGTSNELDLVLTQGIRSFFVSCKLGTPKTPAVEEIAVLTRRFGGPDARAVLATASDLSRESPAVKQRAQDMGVTIIQRENYLDGSVWDIFRSL